MAEVAKSSKRSKESGRFLPYDEYLDRFGKEVGALQRLWLILLALGAFWLAIENSFQTFNAIRYEVQALEADLERARDSRNSLRDRAKYVKWSTAQEVQAAAQGADSKAVNLKVEERLEAAVQADPRTQEERERLLALRKELSDREERIRTLRGEAVNLRVAGTEMPSRLSYAPTLLLVALLAWLLLFDALRSRAQKHVAAAVADYGTRPAPFGLAGDSTLWITPIADPVSLRLPRTAGRENVSRADILGFLGWTEADHRRNRQLAMLAWVVLASLVLRMLWIAADVTGAFAVKAQFTSELGRFLNLVAVAPLAVLCMWALARLASPPADETEVTDPGRRQLLLLGSAALATLGAVWAKGNFSQWFGSSSGPRRPVSDRIVRSPRFVPPKARLERKAAYRVILRIPRSPGTILAKQLPEKEDDGTPIGGTRKFAFHGAGSDRLARFYSRVQLSQSGERVIPLLRRLHGMEPALFAAVAGRIRRPPPPRSRAGRADPPTPPESANALPKITDKIPDKLPIAPLEAAALAQLEMGKLNAACDILLGACRLTARTNRPDLRVFDLIVGLATRYKPVARYRVLAEELIGDAARLMGPPGSAWRRLAERKSKWDKPAWQARWTSQKALSWGHPLDIDQAVSRRWFLWSTTRREHPRLVHLPLNLDRRRTAAR